MRKLLFLLFILTVSLLQGQSDMTPIEAKALREQVKTLAESTTTIVSDFTQNKHLDFLSNDIESTGTLYFKAPDVVKWEYKTPYSYTALFKSNTLYINNEGDKSSMDMASNKLFKRLIELIANSIRGNLFDEELFAISYFKNGNKRTAHFAPKDSEFALYIKEFQIDFGAEGEVVQLIMLEPSEDYTKIVFSNRKVNQTIEDAVFAH